jgi:tetratricopeptide (TPR) repeat protein
MAAKNKTEVVEQVVESGTSKINEVEGLAGVMNFFKKYQNYFFIGIIAILLGVIAYTFFGKKANPKKDAQSFASMQFALSAMSKDSFELALNGDGTNPGLLAVIKKASGTSTEKIARMEAAKCYLQTDKPQLAFKMLEDADGFGKQINARRLSLMGDAKSELATGSEPTNVKLAQEAIDYYEKAANQFPEDTYSANYLFRAAQLSEKIGKNEDAKKTYFKIKEKYTDNTAVIRDVEKYLGKLGVEK